MITQYFVSSKIWKVIGCEVDERMNVVSYWSFLPNNLYYFLERHRVGSYLCLHYEVAGASWRRPFGLKEEFWLWLCSFDGLYTGGVVRGETVEWCI